MSRGHFNSTSSRVHLRNKGGNAHTCGRGGADLRVSISLPTTKMWVSRSCVFQGRARCCLCHEISADSKPCAVGGTVPTSRKFGETWGTHITFVLAKSKTGLGLSLPAQRKPRCLGHPSYGGERRGRGRPRHILRSLICTARIACVGHLSPGRISQRFPRHCKIIQS